MSVIIIPKTVNAFAKWAEENGYNLNIEDRPEYTCIAILRENDWLVDIHFLKNSNARRFFTIGPNYPLDIPRGVFEDDPDLHWLFFDPSDHPDQPLACCGLCSIISPFSPFCRPCYRKRLARQTCIWWLLVGPHVLSNKDIVGHIAGMIVGH